MKNQNFIRSMLFAISLLATACNRVTPPQQSGSEPKAMGNQVPGPTDSQASAGDSPPLQSRQAQTVQVDSGAERQDARDAERIPALIRELAKMEDPNLGLSPTMSGEGFAPVPWVQSMMSGILMNHGLNSTDAFTQLVEYGPAALPYLLESIDDKTPTQLTIEHGGGFGGMWYGNRPAIRWVASQADTIRYLVEEKADDAKIAAAVEASPEFIELAKRRQFPLLLPQSIREFNPRNPAEKKVIEEARREFVEMKEEPRDSDTIEEYTVTVGDVCYVIIGQITNRTYLAAQYQPTACVYIHSPTHDPRIAADVRAAWTSDNPAKLLLASLRTDLESNEGYGRYHPGAVLRLGYYFPEEGEALQLELLAKIDSPAPQGDDSEEYSSFENVRLLEAIVATKSDAVQEHVFRIMKTTNKVDYFLTLSQAYGTEQDALILQRTMKFIDTLPEKDDYDSIGISLLTMLGDRYPDDGKRVFQQFVESPSTHRRDTVINALWYSPLAAELLSPLLDDRRVLHYRNRARVCDRAAQAISNNEQHLAFKEEANEKSRDGQIQKIKLHCIGIGVRKTGGEP